MEATDGDGFDDGDGIEAGNDEGFDDGDGMEPGDDEGLGIDGGLGIDEGGELDELLELWLEDCWLDDCCCSVLQAVSDSSIAIASIKVDRFGINVMAASKSSPASRLFWQTIAEV